jgi:threonine dehydratase
MVTTAWLGIEATVVVPKNNNPVKNMAIRLTGAQSIEAATMCEAASEVVDEP